MLTKIYITMSIVILLVAGVSIYEYGKYTTDSHYTSFIDVQYNYSLSSAINALTQLEKSTNENLYNQITQCSILTNDISIAIMMKTPHYNIYSSNEQIGLGFIYNHIQLYSRMLQETATSNYTNEEILILVSQIKEDLIKIQSANLLKGNEKNFEILQYKWENLSKTLLFPPL